LAFSPLLALAGGDVETELFLFRCGLLALYLAGPAKKFQRSSIQ